MDEYPDMVRQMDAEGHELGNHSWSHTYPDNMSGYDEEMKEYLDCSDIMEKLLVIGPRATALPRGNSVLIHWTFWSSICRRSHIPAT